MRILFAGTPEYAVPSLRALAGLKPQHEVAGVVTQPDRPRGRSREPAPPPVKEAALALSLPGERIFQPESINEAEVLAALRALEPDLVCVIAYGGLLRKKALAVPKLYALNAHGSLLPKHRGAAPIQAALLAGDAATGVTIMRMAPELDAGPMLLQREIPIAPAETAATLHDRLAELSAKCFVEAVELIASGRAVFTPQDESQATYAPKLTKDFGLVDWTREAAYLERFVRAMTPWPGAWSTLCAPDGTQPRRVRIAAAERAPSGLTGAASESQRASAGAPGQAWTHLASDGARLDVRCGGGGVLSIRAVQPEAGREMSVAEFLRGTGRAYAAGCRMK